MSPIILGLWSVVLEPGKTYTQNTHTAIQVTNISFGAEVTGKERSVVTLKYPEFEQDDEDDDDSEDEAEDEDEDDEDGDIKLPKIITKETVLAVLKPESIEQASVNVSLVEDVEVVELSVTGPNKVYLTGHYVRQEEFDQPPSDYDSEFDSEIDSDFDEDDEEDEDDVDMDGLIGSDEEEDDEEDAKRFEEIKELVKEKESKPASKKRAAEEESAAAVSSDAAEAGLSKNQKKKLAKKLKGADGAAAEAPVAAKAAAPVAAAPSPAAKKPEAPAKQTLAGGLVIVDAKKGDGPAAKAGKKVGMRYIGKLDNGKIFDSNTKGSPLTFNLGRGEVIKGWDQGIVGMQVGGERKLTIPAALAYGKKGTQGIPGNATLHFEVKLVSLK